MGRQHIMANDDQQWKYRRCVTAFATAVMLIVFTYLKNSVATGLGGKAVQAVLSFGSVGADAFVNGGIFMISSVLFYGCLIWGIIELVIALMSGEDTNSVQEAIAEPTPAAPQVRVVRPSLNQV